MDNIYECGQLYTALSRATDPGKLVSEGSVTADKARVLPEFKHFHAGVSTAWASRHGPLNLCDLANRRDFLFSMSSRCREMRVV